MPSTSKKQHNFMAAIAHSPAFAKKVGVPQSVGQDFNKADKGHKFSKGGSMATKGVNPFARFEKSGKDTETKGKGKEGSKREEAFDRMQMKGMAEGGMTDTAQDKAMIKKAFKQHDAQEHKGGTGTALKLAKGGVFRTSANGIAQRGKTDAMMPKMAEGGVAKRSAGAGRGFVNPQRSDESDEDYITPKQRYDMERAMEEKKAQAAANKQYDKGSFAGGGRIKRMAEGGLTQPTGIPTQMGSPAAQAPMPQAQAPMPQGRPPMPQGRPGQVAGYAKGGKVDGIAQRGKTRGRIC